MAAFVEAGNKDEVAEVRVEFSAEINPLDALLIAEFSVLLASPKFELVKLTKLLISPSLNFISHWTKAIVSLIADVEAFPTADLNVDSAFSSLSVFGRVDAELRDEITDETAEGY